MAEIVVRPSDLHPLLRRIARHAHDAGSEVRAEGCGDVRQRNPILRPLWTGEGGLDGAEVELQRIGEDRIGRGSIAPEALRLAVRLDQLDPMLVTAGEAEIADGGGIDREEAAGRAVFRRHVGDGGAIRQRQVVKAGSEELDELAHHTLLAKHLGDGQHQIGRGDAFLQLAVQAEADDVGDQHGDRLAEHRRLRLNPTDTPAEYAQPVHHGGVAVRAVAAIGIDIGVADIRRGPDHLRQVFEVHLVADAGARRDNTEIIEGRLPPAEELIALAITLELHIDVLLKRVGGTRIVDHHRVIDDQINRHQRVHLPRIAAELDDAVAHGGQIDDPGHTGEILHQNARRAEGDFLVRTALGQPAGNRAGVIDRVAAAVLKAQHVLEQHLQAVGQAGNIADRLRRGGKAEIVIRLAVDREGLAGLQAVLPDHAHDPEPSSIGVQRGGPAAGAVAAQHAGV